MAKKTTKDNVLKPVANCDQLEEPITIVISLLTFQKLRI